jgi:hypothetical protein
MNELIECYGIGDDDDDDTSITLLVPTVIEKTPLKTEDTGKMFEMAICLAYGIPYDGKYKYGMEIPEKLQPRLAPLVELLPGLKHTAKRGARYDFTANDATSTKYLSAKTTKKGVGKVAPQVIGQCQPKLLCDFLGIEFTNVADLKMYIQTHPTRILSVLVEYTFDCPHLYYNQEKDTIRFITLTTPIDWETLNYTYKWTCSYENWSNSSTLKVVYDGSEMALVEFQFHTKSRTNMAIRWCYENFLTIFQQKLDIVHL